MGRTAGPSTALRSGPNEQIVRPERKSVVGLRPSFSAHVRWCEHGAPLQSCGDRGRLRGRPVVSHRLRLLGLRMGRNCRSLGCARDEQIRFPLCLPMLLSHPSIGGRDKAKSAFTPPFTCYRQVSCRPHRNESQLVIEVRGSPRRRSPSLGLCLPPSPPGGR